MEAYPLVDVLNLDAEIKHLRHLLASSKGIPKPWRWDKSELQAELGWLEKRREQLVQALAGVRVEHSMREIIVDRPVEPGGCSQANTL